VIAPVKTQPATVRLAAPELGLAERERAYSPSSCIGGDYRPFLQQYQQRSDAARALPHQEHAYGGLPRQRLDLFLPAQPQGAARPPALLVFIHGGYWQELSKHSACFAAPACLAAGHAFAAVGYTLAPEASVEQIVQECRTALVWLHHHAARLGYDPTRIVLAGSSAGAHLAAMCTLRGWPHDCGLPAGAVLVSGVYELAPLVGTTINTALGLTRDSASSVSPLHYSLAGFARSVLAWGEIETDEFKRQSRAFAQALQTQGLPEVPTLEVPARNHFDVVLDLCEPGTLLGDATLALLASV
jgi:arylformamidase